jgi:hypothetical protein
MGWRSARSLVGLLVILGTACGSESKRPDGGGAVGGSGGATGGSAGGAGAAGLGPSAGAGFSAGGAGDGGVAGSFAGASGGGSSGAGMGGSAGASAGVGGMVAEGCLAAPAPRLTSGTVLELPIELTFGGTPLLFAEANPVPGGGTLTPLGVRFYLSNVALLRDGAEPLPVDVVTSTATVAPYGIHFFNADDDTSTTLRVLAPPGEYQGLTFLWGLDQSCNTRIPESSVAPLSPTSGMTWPHTGFLFFRYEGRSMPSGQADAGAGGGGSRAAAEANAGGEGGAGNPASMYPPVIHMGGNLFEPLAPIIRMAGVVSVPATGTPMKGLHVALDEIFKGALADIDITDFAGPPGEEVILGERLRRSVPALTVFTFAP